ncbi:hypothetical protein ABZS79_24885 [Streptomyces griseoloalbus]|uniref:hypothetical protein n=1 Tax=Streptomyces griseoloalbus TaxID=67303 RepID=UPI0033B867AE
MNDRSVGVEIDATAKWLEERGIVGAARLLRRVAHQRDEAVRLLGLRPSSHAHQVVGGECTAPRDLDAAAEAAMLRTDVARFQTLAERVGWVSDPNAKRLWRWRDGWWELSYHRRNPKDGYHDTGWYLWGPPESCVGEWTATLKNDATREADRLITQHLAAMAEVRR